MSDSPTPGDAQPGNTPTTKIRVTVDVDPAELRNWAMQHASAGHHGVAYVLFEAADRYDEMVDWK